MALDLDSVVRVSGAGCNHFTITYSVDGTNRSPTLDRAFIENLLEGVDSGIPGNYKDLLMGLMIRYYFEKGYTLAQLPAKCQLPD